MKSFLFIGIDFSKSKFDVLAAEHIEEKKVAQATFENSETGYKEFLKWTAKQSKAKRDDWLFCGEHTGVYSRGVSDFLAKKRTCLSGLKIRCKSGKVKALSELKPAVSIRLSLQCMPAGLSTGLWLTDLQKRGLTL
ncbi:MAG: hypothetical protein LBV41_09660 [Cytophagaceae bacterium]|nr:hypothetical protein [Cytophagaceae bacterium]